FSRISTLCASILFTPPVFKASCVQGEINNIGPHEAWYSRQGGFLEDFEITHMHGCAVEVRWISCIREMEMTALLYLP
ncbi:hypothetical protein FPV67DRAFT_1509782, partial [Lyophyllum atratum]